MAAAFASPNPLVRWLWGDAALGFWAPLNLVEGWQLETRISCMHLLPLDVALCASVTPLQLQTTKASSDLDRSP